VKNTRNIIVLLLLGFCCLFVPSTGFAEGNAEDPTTSKLFVLAKQPDLMTRPPETVIISGDSVVVTLRNILDFIERNSRHSEEARQFFQTPDGFAVAARSLLQTGLLIAHAEKNGIDKRPEFLAELEEIRKNVLANYAYRALMEEFPVSDEELRAFFDAHRFEFGFPETVRVARILVKTREEAEELRTRVERGESFEDLAREKSLCFSASDGGDLGPFERTGDDPELERLYFGWLDRMKQNGEEIPSSFLEGPVQDESGQWALYRFFEHLDGVSPDYEAMSADIAMRFRQERANGPWTEELFRRLEHELAITVLSGDSAIMH
jgi:peptidyl-prolyl cis-trans isomerase C